MDPSPRRLSRDDYTVACLCPMGVELAAVEGILDEIDESLPCSRGTNGYTLGRMGVHNVVVAVMPEIGNNRAAVVATQLLNDFPSVRFGLLVGIGGTGTYGGEAFENNFAKLLKASSFGDPVWLNIPWRMCDESPKNAEHVAYPIHDISSRSREKVAIVALPQGNLSTQWSLRYWPNTRDQVSNFICFPADFRGTINAWGLCLFNGTQPCTPAVWHQTRNSNFIATLRSNGGEDNRFGREPSDSWLAVVQSWTKSMGNDSEAKLAV